MAANGGNGEGASPKLDYDVERTPSLYSHTASSITQGETDGQDAADMEKAMPLQDPVPASTLGEPQGDADPAGVLSRTRSQASSTVRRAATVIPRKERRGLFARFALLPEVDRPYDYNNSTKWCITAVVAAAGAAAPLGSSILYPSLDTISKQFHSTSTITNLSVAMYSVSMALFPIWWSAFSEESGRRTVYITSFSLFVIFSAICANSQSMAMLIIFRICIGGAAASVQAVGAGTIADIWETYERGRAMSLFYLGPLLGPLLAPVIGGALAEGLSWRATQYFLVIYGFGCLMLITFMLPETLARRKSYEPAVNDESLGRTTTRESAVVKTKRFGAKAKRFLIDPLKVLLFLRFPPVLLTVLLAAIAFGALFIAQIGIQQGYSHAPYSYSELIVGVLYLPSGLGYFLASFFGGRWLDNIMAREARRANRYDEKGKLIYLPEDRMRENMWFANTVYPLSLLWFGWSLQYGVQFMCPSVALFFFGISSMLVFSASTTMLTEFVRKKSSAGIAINNFVRNILSCVGAVVAAPWYDAIGYGWVLTAVCIFCMLVGCLGTWTLRRNGSKWRKAMDEALKDM